MKREDYYAESQSWGDEAAASARRASRLAWIVAGVAAVVALAEALALVALVPLKTVQPYVIAVDRSTGQISAPQPLAAGALTQNQAVAQSALVQYVIARESFDATDLKDNYRKVQLWSGAEARNAYIAGMSAQNPQSPLRMFPPATTVAITVKGVSLLSDSTAIVRFDAERRDPGAASGQVTPYTAAITYRFSGEPLSAEARFVNPLGFQVIRYRRDAEALAPATVPINPLRPAN